VTEPSANRWRGVPARARAAERRELLVEAAFDLLGTDGIAGTTVRKVCETARLNPRYFYESFTDLDALLVAVFDRVASEAVIAMSEAALTLDVPLEGEALVRAGLGAIIRHVVEDPRRTRVLFMEGLANPALGQRRFDLLHAMADWMVADARQRIEQQLGVPVEPVSTVVVAANLMVGGLAELLLAWVNGRVEVTIDDLIEDTAALFVAIAESIDGIIEARGSAS
jgi:AcrR family transcriptional regulator